MTAGTVAVSLPREGELRWGATDPRPDRPARRVARRGPADRARRRVPPPPHVRPALAAEHLLPVLRADPPTPGRRARAPRSSRPRSARGPRRRGRRRDRGGRPLRGRRRRPRRRARGHRRGRLAASRARCPPERPARRPGAVAGVHGLHRHGAGREPGGARAHAHHLSRRARPVRVRAVRGLCPVAQRDRRGRGCGRRTAARTRCRRSPRPCCRRDRSRDRSTAPVRTSGRSRRPTSSSAMQSTDRRRTRASA